jgi:2,4-dienoyl-CoA reductase-like NADH-dependent reductase (Old Yellow Enzyme family)/thioredoxin reductase
MKHRYEHILTPIRIGNVFIKNRIMATRSVSQELQGPENYPAESTIAYLEHYAVNGAALVVCPIGSWPDDRTENSFVSMFEMEDRRVLNYFGQMTRRIHRHGALALGSLNCSIPQRYAISERRHPELVKKPLAGPGGDFLPDGKPAPPKPEMTKEQITGFIKSFAGKCAVIKACGFDGVNVYMSYNTSILAHSLSPVLNQRIDEYGGSPENRARLTIELFRAVKDTCGQDFLVECQISGEEDMPNGYTTEDFLDYAKICEGLVDIFEIRAKSMVLSHPSSYSCPEHEPVTIRYAEAFKKRGIKALCAPVGGYQNLDDIERFIAGGRTDIVAMARAFICDSEYGEKLLDEREDIVPCIRCDKCHGGVCSVNPKVGSAHIPEGWPALPRRVKNVAVIGGGPAGMRAALEATRRGHAVTLFEAKPYLGGQLIHADYMPGKWSLKRYKDYLIDRLDETGVKPRLDIAATPDMIAAGGFDAVIAAPGSEPKIPPVPGGDDPRIWAPIDCFGRETELGERVTVIGGASVGSETALYLADNGHQVTLVTRKDRVCYDDMSHGARFLYDLIVNHPNIRAIPDTRTLSVKDGVVAVLAGGANGEAFEVPADALVFSAGAAPRVEACTDFAGLTPEFFVIGDASVQDDIAYLPFEFMESSAKLFGGNVKHATATAYAAAMSL